MLHAGLSAADEAPTIISKKLPIPTQLDGTFAEILRGRRLAHFELLEPIGVGGMAAVILSRDTQLERTVALKILPPEMASDPENILRFHQEARAAARLDHENIARVFFCGEDQGLHFIAFEFVEGENLRTVLERRGRIPVPEVIHIMLQIATGLAHASERGVVHRDIKPSNIILSPNGRAKLVDMGLARSLHGDTGLTQSGVTLGTFDYISPEQALEPRDADARSDIYSLGCTFYHMVTGQPPVPEGTAAKKLHHHQHIAPVDPRQLNSAIPDDVAAIMARMMAKDPKDRYQRPEHLVQHLILMAQKLGTATEVPEGVLFVDAPLPSPPRTRPVLMTASALLGLVVLIVLLGPSTWPWHSAARVPANGGRSSNEKAKVSPGGTAPASDNEGSQAALPARPIPAAPLEPEPRAYRVDSARDLVDLLSKPAVDKTQPTVVSLEKDLELTREELLVFQERNWLLQAGETHRRRPTIRLVYDPAWERGPWAALTVKSGKVTLRGLRFEVHGGGSEMRLSALALQGGELTVENCEFVQASPPEIEPGRLSSVAVQGPSGEGDKPVLRLSGCYFAGGQHAVTLQGAKGIADWRLEIADCAFAPHTGALFLVQGANQTNGNLQSATCNLRLRSCSAFVLDGAVFRLEDGTACRLEVRNSIFSRPEGDGRTPGIAALIQETGPTAGHFQYHGARNAYHNLKAYWVKSAAEANAEPVTTLEAFREQHQDEHSRELRSSPWKHPDPLALLTTDPPQIRQAFQLNERLAELRQREDSTKFVGVERCTWGETYDGRLAPLEERRPTDPVVRKERLVDPKVKEIGNGVYPTLAQALADAKPGEVILIKHSGLLAVDPVRMEKADTDVTIKPQAGYHPLLTLGRTADIDAALFRVHNGQLRLEQLEFLLRPAQAGFKSQTVASVVGAGQCTFKDCVATLDGSDVHLALVTLADPNTAMRLESRAGRQAPEVRFQDCFVRGEGDLVLARASRPFKLELDNALIVVTGSLLAVEGNSDDTPAQPPAQLVLNHLTAQVSDHVIHLRASKNSKGLVGTSVLASDCLFAAAGSKSLIHLEGLENEEQMKRLVAWRGERNVYSNFQQLLDQQPKESDTMPPPPYGKTQWESLTRESDGRFDKVRFTTAPNAEGMLTRVLPADFKVKAESELSNCGADVDRLLKPAEEDGTGTVRPSD